VVGANGQLSNVFRKGTRNLNNTAERILRFHKETTKKALRACPPEDQADVIHAISPISVKLGQIEGHTQ